jgi:hypothetical protein
MAWWDDAPPFFSQLRPLLGGHTGFDFDALAGQGAAPALGAYDYTSGWDDRPFFNDAFASQAGRGWDEPTFQNASRQAPAGIGAVDVGPSAYALRRQARKDAAARAAGETTPTSDRSDTTSPADYTGVVPTGTRDTVLRWLPQVQAKAQQYGVPVELVLAVMHNESGGDPKAQSPYNPGQGYARGLLQMMPFHFKAGQDPFDPETNLDIGVRYLASNYHRFGRDPEKAMAAHFGGPGIIDANGNIRTDVGDMNITAGKYITERFRPAYAAYRTYIQNAEGRPQAAQGQADLADLWAWLGGSRQPITGRFGAKDGPYPGTGHRGMDIGTPAGMALTSPVEGVVLAAGDVGGGYGQQVRIQTAWGSVLLGHLGQVNVRVGQRIQAGTMLGVTGNTGTSTGPHLHFELRDRNDAPIDPARYYRW